MVLFAGGDSFGIGKSPHEDVAGRIPLLTVFNLHFNQGNIRVVGAFGEKAAKILASQLLDFLLVIYHAGFTRNGNVGGFVRVSIAQANLAVCLYLADFLGIFFREEPQRFLVARLAGVHGPAMQLLLRVEGGEGSVLYVLYFFQKLAYVLGYCNLLSHKINKKQSGICLAIRVSSPLALRSLSLNINDLLKFS